MNIMICIFAVIGMVYTSICVGEIIYGVYLAFREEEPKANIHKMKIWAKTAEIILRIQLLYHEISLDKELKKLEEAQKELDELKEERDQWLKELEWINHRK